MLKKRTSICEVIYKDKSNEFWLVLIWTLTTRSLSSSLRGWFLESFSQASASRSSLFVKCCILVCGWLSSGASGMTSNRSNSIMVDSVERISELSLLKVVLILMIRLYKEKRLFSKALKSYINNGWICNWAWCEQYASDRLVQDVGLQGITIQYNINVDWSQYHSEEKHTKREKKKQKNFTMLELPPKMHLKFPTSKVSSTSQHVRVKNQTHLSTRMS